MMACSAGYLHHDGKLEPVHRHARSEGRLATSLLASRDDHARTGSLTSVWEQPGGVTEMAAAVMVSNICTGNCDVSTGCVDGLAADLLILP